MATNQLSALALRSVKPRPKPFKLTDGEGLYLLVRPTGAWLWQMAFRFGGKQKTHSIGPYPKVSLSAARMARGEAKALLAENRDPTVVKKLAKTNGVVEVENTVEAVAREWHATKKAGWRKSYADLVMSRLEKDLFPEIGNLNVGAVEPPVLLKALRKIEIRGTTHVSKKVRQHAGQIFRYAIGTSRATRDPSADLKGVLKAPPRAKNHASMKALELPTFFTRLTRYDGDAPTRVGLEFVVYTMVRTVEARFATWPEFEDLDGATPLWRIPGTRMKKHLEHLVPLTTQTVEMLHRLRKSAGKSIYVFPKQVELKGSKSPVISENTFLYALYRMGYHGRATVHGFRTTASTILNEQEFNKDWIERQLAHVDQDQVRGTYNSAEWIKGRRKMMLWWADYLDKAKETADLVG